MNKLNNRFSKLLIISSTLTCISTGILQSWEDLNDYELQRENLKSQSKKIERSAIGFGKGMIIGCGLIFLSPIIIPGVTISLAHTYLKK